MNPRLPSRSMIVVLTFVVIGGAILLYAVRRQMVLSAITQCQDYIAAWSQTLDHISQPLRLWHVWGAACLEQGFMPIEFGSDGLYRIWSPTQVNFAQPVADNLFRVSHPLENKENLQAWMCQKRRFVLIGATRKSDYEMRTNLITRDGGVVVFVEELTLRAQSGASEFRMFKNEASRSPEVTVFFRQGECSLEKTLKLVPKARELPIYFNGTQTLQQEILGAS